MKIKQVVIAIIKKDNKYLLTKRVSFDTEDIEYSPYVWNTPGGGIEINESAEDALLRETWEELHIKIEKYKLVPKTFIDTRHNCQYIFSLFICKLKDEDQEIILNEEANEYRWVTIEEAKKLKSLPKMVEMLEEADKIKLI